MALDFDNSNDEITLPSFSMPTMSAVSICVWEQLDSSAGGNTLSGAKIGGSYKIGYFENGTNNRTFRIDANSNVTNSSAAFTDGVHHMFTGTYDGSNVRSYRNGSNVDTDANTGNVDTGTVSYSIGSGGATNWWDGRIEDYRIYFGYTLSQAEIDTIYWSRGRDPIAARADHRYPMNEAAPGGTSATVYDHGHGGAEGTLNGTAAGSPAYLESDLDGYRRRAP